ncbi:MAG: creatininase family protein [Aggregatilineales bacterium]
MIIPRVDIECRVQFFPNKLLADLATQERKAMQWEELTGDQFPQAVSAVQHVCLLPLSVIERHGHHMPLGTDMYIGREICRRAAALESAIIFPDFIFTQILEAQHVPGTIAVESDLFLRMLDNICREIARNGLDKIILVNAHGGNDHLIHFFAQIQLQSPRDYVVYVADRGVLPEDQATIKALWQTTVDGHAGEIETSVILAIRPDLVHMDQLRSGGEGMPLERLKTLRDMGIDTGIWWYADHPTHYRGDGRSATDEKGDIYLTARARALACVIRVVKDDQTTKRLQDEFFSASQH